MFMRITDRLLRLLTADKSRPNIARCPGPSEDPPLKTLLRSDASTTGRPPPGPRFLDTTHEDRTKTTTNATAATTPNVETRHDVHDFPVPWQRESRGKRFGNNNNANGRRLRVRARAVAGVRVHAASAVRASRATTRRAVVTPPPPNVEQNQNP